MHRFAFDLIVRTKCMGGFSSSFFPVCSVPLFALSRQALTTSGQAAVLGDNPTKS